jgi:hypothetical protein
LSRAHLPESARLWAEPVGGGKRREKTAHKEKRRPEGRRLFALR